MIEIQGCEFFRDRVWSITTAPSGLHIEIVPDPEMIEEALREEFEEPEEFEVLVLSTPSDCSRFLEWWMG